VAAFELFRLLVLLYIIAERVCCDVAVTNINLYNFIRRVPCDDSLSHIHLPFEANSLVAKVLQRALVIWWRTTAFPITSTCKRWHDIVDFDAAVDRCERSLREQCCRASAEADRSNATQAPGATFDGGGELKRCDCDIDDTAPLADVGQRPTKSRRLDVDAPTSSMGVRPVAAASDIAEKDGGDATADDHFHEVSDVTVPA